MSAAIRDLAFGDIEREIAVTRRVLERLPAGKFDWKAHDKSMSLGQLALHVANLLQWTLDTLERDGFDMESPPPAMRTKPNDLADVLETFDRNAAAVKAALARTDDETLQREWS